MKTIFIVDDNETNRVTAKEALDGIYKTFAVPSAERMFTLSEKITPDLILLDIDMPQMDGFTAMERLKEDAKLYQIPVIFLTAHTESDTETRGFELGAVDFCNKPFSKTVLLQRIKRAIDTDAVIKESQMALRGLQNATINVIAEVVEGRDTVTGSHIERTQTYLEILLKELARTGVYADEISKWDLTIVVPSAQLHDLGKITVSDLILNKAGILTEDEFKSIQSHTKAGEKLIDDIMQKTKDDGFLQHAKLFAGYHHEKWNGTGYPRALSGGDIPLQGRLMAIPDVYDALVSARPYKKPFPHKEAVEIIKNDSGTHFDPKIVEAFLNISEDFLRRSIMGTN